MSITREKSTLRDSYTQSLFTKEDQVLKNIRLSAGDKASMQISPQQANFLFILIKLSNVKSILEIGTFIGYSSVWMARAIPDDGKIITIEKNKAHYKIAKQNISQSEVSDKIEVKNIDARSYMQKAVELYKKFDAIFIDGRKDQYLEYLNLSDKILNNSGLIIADNTLLFDTVTSEKEPGSANMRKMYTIMREFNSKLANSKNYTSTLLPIYDGLTIAIKR